MNVVTKHKFMCNYVEQSIIKCMIEQIIIWKCGLSVFLTFKNLKFSKVSKLFSIYIKYSLHLNIYNFFFYYYY